MILIYGLLWVEGGRHLLDWKGAQWVQAVLVLRDTLIPKIIFIFWFAPKTPSGRGSQNFEIPWEVKKLKCSNPYIWGPKRCKMTRGFRIWPWNLNLITFDPLFGQKTVKIEENRDLVCFWPFFGQKGGQMLSDSNFKARFGILASFCIC